MSVSRGQITLQPAIRRMLNLKAKDRVEFRIVEGQVVISPARSTPQEHFQSILPFGHPISDEEAVRQAVEAHTEEVAREGL